MELRRIIEAKTRVAVAFQEGNVIVVVKVINRDVVRSLVPGLPWAQESQDLGSSNLPISTNSLQIFRRAVDMRVVPQKGCKQKVIKG